jgi:integrase
MKTQRGIFQKIPGGKWWIRYVANGKYHRESVGSYTAAETLLKKRHGDAVSQRKMPDTIRKRVVTFGELLEDALAWSREHKLSWRDDESLAVLLREWWGDHDAASLTAQEIQAQLSHAARTRKWGASTFNHYRSFLMLCFREGRLAGKVTVNPPRDVRHQKEDNSRVRYLNQFEPLPTEIPYLKPHTTEASRLRAVIEHDYPSHLREFEPGLASGIRKGNLYGLTWTMIDWNNRMINLPRSKNGEALHLPLNQAALAALRAVHTPGATGRVFTSAKTGRALDNSKHWFEKAVVTAGVRDFVWHDLRHCFASSLRMHGAKLEDIAELLGQKSLQMTKRYAHLGPSYLAKASSLLDLSDSTSVAPATEKPDVILPTFLN